MVHLPAEDGGAKKKHGGKREQGAASGTLSKPRDDAAEILRIGTDKARALETVFTTPNVPAELKAAVNRGDVASTRADYSLV